MRSEQFSFITGDIAATTSAFLPQGWGCEGELMFCLTELGFLLSPLSWAQRVAGDQGESSFCAVLAPTLIFC